MVHKRRHHLLAQFSIPFHMVWSVLLRVVAQKTTFWLVEIFLQPIRSFYSMVFEATTRNKMKHIMWKGMENCAREWCLYLCTILLEVTLAFWKMWDIKYFPKCLPFKEKNSTPHMRQLSAHKMPYITFNFNANLWMNINNDVDDTMRLAFQLNK